MLHDEPLEDGAEVPPLEAGGAEDADQRSDLAQRALEELDRLLRAPLRLGERGELAGQQLEMRDRREEVLHRTVVHVEHDALELALPGRQESEGGAPR